METISSNPVTTVLHDDSNVTDIQTSQKAKTAPKGCLLTILVNLIGILVLGIWTFVGLYLWIPLLIRTSLAYSTSVVGAVISGHSIAQAERALNEAIVLYSKGFTTIISSLRRILTDELELPNAQPTEISWKRAIFEFFFATLLWSAPFLIAANLNHR